MRSKAACRSRSCGGWTRSRSRVLQQRRPCSRRSGLEMAWQLRDSERVITGNAALLGAKHFLVGLTRVRNEALLLPDTLDYLSAHVDAIVAYDDASTDDTVEILKRHPKVALIVANGAWEE